MAGSSNHGMGLPSDGQTITFNHGDSSFVINPVLSGLAPLAGHPRAHQALLPEVRITFQPATYGDTTILPLPHQPQAIPGHQIVPHQLHQAEPGDLAPNGDPVTITKCWPSTSASEQQHPSSTTVSTATTPRGGKASKDPKDAAPMLGYRPCHAELAAKSELELRRKGTNFLRHHATKHGIINASRKRLDTVVRELSNHYLSVHKFVLVPEPVSAKTSGKKQKGTSSPVAAKPEPHVKAELPETVTTAPPVTLTPTVSASPPRNQAAFMVQDMQHYFHQPSLYAHPPPLPATTVSSAPSDSAPHFACAYQNPAVQVQLPTHPLPPEPTLGYANGLPHSVAPSGQGPSRALNANSPNCQKKITTTKPSPAVKQEWAVKPEDSGDGGTHYCASPIVAKNRNELSLLSTSKLRPQASAHKVFNSSRKTKNEVVDELWRHYLMHHAEALGLDPLNDEPPQMVQPAPLPVYAPDIGPDDVSRGGNALKIFG